MKRTIAAFVAGVVLASAATAGAVGTSRLFRLVAGDKAQFASMECDTATTVAESSFTCVGGGSGFRYGVSLGTKYVSVLDFTTNKFVFHKNQ